MAANFILQMVWYTALFSKAWSKEMGYDPNMRPDKKAMLKGMALTSIGLFLFANLKIIKRGRLPIFPHFVRWSGL